MWEIRFGAEAFNCWVLLRMSCLWDFTCWEGRNSSPKSELKQCHHLARSDRIPFFTCSMAALGSYFSPNVYYEVNYTKVGMWVVGILSREDKKSRKQCLGSKLHQISFRSTQAAEFVGHIVLWTYRQCRTLWIQRWPNLFVYFVFCYTALAASPQAPPPTVESQVDT